MKCLLFICLLIPFSIVVAQTEPTTPEIPSMNTLFANIGDAATYKWAAARGNKKWQKHADFMKNPIRQNAVKRLFHELNQAAVCIWALDKVRGPGESEWWVNDYKELVSPDHIRAHIKEMKNLKPVNKCFDPNDPTVLVFKLMFPHRNLDDPMPVESEEQIRAKTIKNLEQELSDYIHAAYELQHREDRIDFQAKQYLYSFICWGMSLQQ